MLGYESTMADDSSSQNNSEDKQDITRNLPSLAFESALDEDELLLLHLRQQSHAHTVIACASSAFLINILNELRQIRADLAKTSKQRRAIQLLTADSLPKDPLYVGIIGCGRLGSYVAQSLLSFGDVNSSELFISTRRPDTVGKSDLICLPLSYCAHLMPRHSLNHYGAMSHDKQLCIFV